MNLGQAKTKAIQYIRQYSNDGVLTPLGENQDYLLPSNTYANTAQMELAAFERINAVKQVTQNPIPNLLGALQGFDIKAHLATDLTDTIATGVKSYYFEVDNVATIYIEENQGGTWTALETINNATKGQFTAYKNNITPLSATNQVRIRFSGAYPYNIRNRALYAYAFPTAADIPDYRPYNKYPMPTDFMELNKVVQITDPRVYKNMVAYFWEGKNTFVVNCFESGSFDIHYYRYPTVIDETTPDSYEFEIDINAQEAIPFFIASQMISDENITLSVQLMNLYQAKKAELGSRTAEGLITINTIYGM